MSNTLITPTTPKPTIPEGDSPALKLVTVQDSCAKTKKRYLMNDAGNADRLVDAFGRDLIYCPEQGFMVWTETHWAPDDFILVDLSACQRRLVQIMSESQFGRIENLRVQAGQPVFDPGFKVVRVARLCGDGERMGPLPTDDFELKQAIRDLFDELARLEDGVILRLEFRHGLPCLLEMTTNVAAE